MPEANRICTPCHSAIQITRKSINMVPLYSCYRGTA